MFDTHCHLNFSVFKNNIDDVINQARSAGIHNITIPGTDFESSKKAVEIAEQYEGIYAAVGIHPHHIYEIKERCSKEKFCEPLQIVVTKEINKIRPLLSSKKAIAIGEIGIDKHIYQKTKYDEYTVDEIFIEYQKAFFKAQLKLAKEYNKSIILHNREAKIEVLNHIRELWDNQFKNHVVFHCCEPDEELLNFSIEHGIFIGVDGDVTYDKKKQAFIKKIPLELLVLETDSPYLVPHIRQDSGGQAGPLKFPNEPKNLHVIAEFISNLLNVSINRLIDTSSENARKLFQLEEHK